MAARQAKTAHRNFTSADVTPEMIAPELHVYAWSQLNGANQRSRDPIGGNAIGDSAASGAVNVTPIVITPRKGTQEEKMAAAILPTRFERMPVIW